MFKHLIAFTGVLLFVSVLPGKAQNLTPNDTVSKEVVIVDGQQLNEKQLQRYYRQLRKDSIRAHKKIWWSVLGGPSYTPEASLGVGGAVLASFRMNKNDTISQRSFLPAGINLSINGTIVVAGAGTFFFNQNKFRIYASYGYRNEPAHYYGKGYETIEHVDRSDSTTRYHRSYQFKRKYLNVGIGGLIQYDTRNDVATPTQGVLLSGNMKAFGKYLGGAYNYEILELEYRHFVNVFRPRSTLAWIAKSQIGMGDVPYSELPSFGSPFDLRGYYWGKYRDKSMAYGILEYRHMFGSPEKYKSGNFWAKCGFVAWMGTGTIGDTPFDWNKWKLNFGAGLRVQMQPGKNFRLDIGKEPGLDGVQVYMNMTEAF